MVVLWRGLRNRWETLLAAGKELNEQIIFSISDSDFVEMFVGVGASRVRSFEDAKSSTSYYLYR